MLGTCQGHDIKDMPCTCLGHAKDMPSTRLPQVAAVHQRHDEAEVGLGLEGAGQRDDEAAVHTRQDALLHHGRLHTPRTRQGHVKNRADTGGPVAAFGGLVATFGGLMVTLGGLMATLGGLTATLGGLIMSLEDSQPPLEDSWQLWKTHGYPCRTDGISGGLMATL